MQDINKKIDCNCRGEKSFARMNGEEKCAGNVNYQNHDFNKINKMTMIKNNLGNSGNLNKIIVQDENVNNFKMSERRKPSCKQKGADAKHFGKIKKFVLFVAFIGLMAVNGAFAQSGITGPLNWSLSNGTLNN
jgi:hypothetical protein